jgi:hypothetical protein
VLGTDAAASADDLGGHQDTLSRIHGRGTFIAARER